MRTREQILRALEGLPAGMVRWASDPVEERARLSSGVPEVDRLLRGGWPRGRVSALRGKGRGAVTLAVCTSIQVIRAGGLVAWVDGDDSLDPASFPDAALERLLWVRRPLSSLAAMRAVEEVLIAGGFGVVVWTGGSLDERGRRPSRESRTAAWVRIGRAAERSRIPVLALGDEPESCPVPGAVEVHFERMVPVWGEEAGVRVLLGCRVRIACAEETTEVFFPTRDAVAWLEAGWNPESSPAAGTGPAARAGSRGREQGASLESGRKAS